MALAVDQWCISLFIEDLPIKKKKNNVILHSFAKLPDGVVGFYITFRYLQDPEASTETDVFEFRFAVHLTEPENQARCTNQLVIATRECLK